MSSGTFTAPYKLIKCNETGGAAVQLPDGNVYAIQQIMAMFLGKMKEIAEGRFQNKLYDCETHIRAQREKSQKYLVPIDQSDLSIYFETLESKLEQSC